MIAVGLETPPVAQEFMAENKHTDALMPSRLIIGSRKSQAVRRWELNIFAPLFGCDPQGVEHGRLFKDATDDRRISDVNVHQESDERRGKESRDNQSGEEPGI